MEDVQAKLEQIERELYKLGLLKRRKVSSYIYIDVPEGLNLAQDEHPVEEGKLILITSGVGIKTLVRAYGEIKPIGLHVFYDLPEGSLEVDPFNNTYAVHGDEPKYLPIIMEQLGYRRFEVVDVRKHNQMKELLTR